MPGSDHHAQPATRRLLRNAGIRAGIDVLGKVLALVLFAVVARTYGQATLGELAFAQAVIQTLWSFAGLGLDRFVVREVARDHDAVHDVLADALAVKVVAAVIGLVAALGALLVLDEPRRVLVLVVVLGAGLLLMYGTQSAQAVFQARERMELVAWSALPTGLLNTGLGLLAVALGGGIVLVAAATSFAWLVGGVIAWRILVRRFGAPRLRLRPRGWPRLVRRTIPFGAQEALGQVVFRFPTLLLGAVAASAAVGAYGAAYRVLEGTLFLAWAIGTAVMPMFSYLPAARDDDGGDGPALETVYEAALRLVLLLMAPIGAALLVCADAVVRLLYGPEFAEAAALLRILAVAIVAYGVGHISGLLVLVRRPARVTLTYVGAVAVTNVAVCAALIPWLGATGAALATLVSEVLLAVVGAVLAGAVAARPRARRVLLVPGCATAAMVAAMLPLRDELLLALPAGAAAYVLALLLLEGGGVRDELALLRGGRTRAG